MKGVGRIYQQTFVDTYSCVAICKLYTEKTAITAADALNDRVIPFFAEHGIKASLFTSTTLRPAGFGWQATSFWADAGNRTPWVQACRPKSEKPSVTQR